MSFSLSNEYERSLGFRIGDGHYPFDNLVEIWQMTRLQLSDSRGENGPYRWNMSGTHDEERIHSGERVEVRFVALGEHQLTVTDGHGLDVYFNVNVKYVRRELRDLTDEDREIYFEAMHTIYFTEQAEGEKRYGPMFRSASWLVREHLYGAAQRDCDHWHDDAGFFTHHVGVTLQFEQSLRSVDARTCSHYWDYTVDAKAALPMSQSEIFSDNWFGDPNPSGADHAIDTGRFAYTPVMSDARSFSNITNPYGLLRSPWNTNPVPYLMRHNTVAGIRYAGYTLPECSFFQSYVSSTVDLSNVLSALNGYLHGEVHIMLGGHWGFDQAKMDRVHAVFNANVTGETSSPHYSSDQLLLASKFLWRQGYIECPERCSLDQNASSCACEINQNQWDGTDEDALRILEDAGLHTLGMKVLEEWGEGTVKLNEPGLRFSASEILLMLGHVGYPGEMFTSAAPQDPIFWPLHGLGERFVQLLRLANLKGVLTLDETWAYKHFSTVLSDTHLVCDWSDISTPRPFNADDSVEFRQAMPTCHRGETCPGHRENDTLPFKDLLLNSDGEKKYFTNIELYEAVSPWNKDLPYVYDKLTTWPACENGTLFNQSAFNMKA